MDKMNFLKALTELKGKPDEYDNFQGGMEYRDYINAFYEYVTYLLESSQIKNEPKIMPLNFGTLTRISGGITFTMKLSKRDAENFSPKPMQVSGGKCTAVATDGGKIEVTVKLKK